MSWADPPEMVLPASVWVEVEAAAVEVDRRLEVLPVAEAAGGVPDPLDLRVQAFGRRVGDPVAQVGEDVRRSEEHTSELQSLTNLVCRLLLEKKKIKNKQKT